MSIPKSIRFDADVEEYIINFTGSNFSVKLHNIDYFSTK